MKTDALFRIAWPLLALLAGCGAVSDGSGVVDIHPETASAIRVGSYNIRGSTMDRNTPNAWEHRKAALVGLVRKLDLDVFGLQEVSLEQRKYLEKQLAGYGIVGDHRGRNRKSGSASPVAYRKSRFDAESSGTFWLSETPDKPASKSWGTFCTRICTYVVLRDKSAGQRFCFANTHLDNESAEAREKGVRLILKRLGEVGQGIPIVFTGDHNCCYGNAPAKAVREVLKDARDMTETPCRGPHNSFNGFGRCKDGPVKLRNGILKDHCIDYIYVSEGTRVLDFVTHNDKCPGSERYPSDHFPVTATIMLGCRDCGAAACAER